MNDKMRGALECAMQILGGGTEINPNNYDHEDVCALNAAANEAYNVLDAALSQQPESEPVLWISPEEYQAATGPLRIMTEVTLQASKRTGWIALSAYRPSAQVPDGKSLVPSQWLGKLRTADAGTALDLVEALQMGQVNCTAASKAAQVPEFTNHAWEEMAEAMDRRGYGGMRNDMTRDDYAAVFDAAMRAAASIAEPEQEIVELKRQLALAESHLDAYRAVVDGKQPSAQVPEDQIIAAFEKCGMRIESGAQFSARGQIAQLINGARELLAAPSIAEKKEEE